MKSAIIYILMIVCGCLVFLKFRNKEPVVTKMPDGRFHIDRLEPGEWVEIPTEFEFDVSGYDINDLLDAIEQVESGGDPNAVGDNGVAIGSFQLHKIYVDEVNRILEKEGYSERYDYSDRLDSFSSRVMTIIHCGYWHNEHFPYVHFGMNANLREETAEIIARIHNGGSNGWKKESTKPYWEKVKKVLYDRNMATPLAR